ncbi:hypothetical protein M406DRAFT_327443 [Cryphonectria parasitica EP155]|uniref:Uncharacterized protein n=1 Tax=Cryphonectria parasitica (strain ATCC 38755 / EP155) TaxID=660469 RepID=A0A9P4Y943_CRYP1|nr:uncharacterized protein M406DRAFT_327443 [Cryphonectria parasitica EP155]KAF3769036.1 hypothetical protein M406DRAFT_327443 [Cryphonectria parasitica EP155]
MFWGGDGNICTISKALCQSGPSLCIWNHRELHDTCATLPFGMAPVGSEMQLRCGHDHFRRRGRPVAPSPAKKQEEDPQKNDFPEQSLFDMAGNHDRRAVGFKANRWTDSEPSGMPLLTTKCCENAWASLDHLYCASTRYAALLPDEQKEKKKKKGKDATDEQEASWSLEQD